MPYTEDEARRLVIEAGRRLLRENLVARTWGNISARIGSDRFVITPSGRAYETLREEDLAVVSIVDGSSGGDIKPSSEKGVHCSAYALRSGVDFVIHTHQFYASAVGAAGRDTSFAPCAGYGLPGTKKLRKNVERCIGDNPDKKAFLMEKHGAVCLGGNCDDAFENVQELERDCRELFERRVGPVERGQVKEAELDLSAWPHAVRAEGIFAVAYSGLGRTLPAWIDDFAQIVGVGARCADSEHLSDALRGRNAALIRGEGAVCTGNTADDAQAAAAILEKNCAAAFYAAGARPLGMLDAMLQRQVYLRKYSKQIDSH